MDQQLSVPIGVGPPRRLTDVPVPSFGPRLRCERGGHVGAAQGQFMTHLRHRVRPTDLCTKPLAVESMRADAQWQHDIDSGERITDSCSRPAKEGGHE